MNDWKPFYFNNQILNFFCAVAKKQIEYNGIQINEVFIYGLKATT